MSSKRILFISNGHGEDNHTSHVIQTLRQLCPSLQMAAMPIVGEGKAYRNLDIPIIGPTQTMPSGGFFYMKRLYLLKDFQSGLIGLTWRQLQAVLQYAPNCDLIMATGDFVSQTFAYLTKRPFVSFISCLSALYEGRLPINPLLWHDLNSSRCLAVFTRDSYTASDLQRQGIAKARFGGIPALDRLVPAGKDLHLKQDIPMIALLPGSRMPEAARNFCLQLQLVVEIAKVMPESGFQFRAALVPNLMEQLDYIAKSQGWQLSEGVLTYSPPGSSAEKSPLVEVRCYSDAFNDIVYYSNLVIGMAGLAVDLAVAIGKPIIQIPGEGPQFTYQFAEAQTRLLGISAQTIGTGPATPETLKQAAPRVVETLQDADYLAKCQQNGPERFGPPGASERIAHFLLTSLGET
ncbi:MULTISPECIES: lipid-A-disaccharide synthase-related protein [unclassified Nostoc]|uniref:lipid-A-disaccharide synthase-related protein n=1 Tax=unclassified Nostoc TaxID=2593658 RepID=UPI002AD460F1|nr:MULTISPECIES: lipid-A-disaccharide synthase-related protein [unclassified Nostoc]MDZ8125450.1 lipid-A-disaccharide synthase-related protein [Nostoc sp. CmiVER01]MDZ8222062.1 lipid-A-disaccharide synthase-related protein [Nostoc sp. ChiVER01]